MREKSFPDLIAMMTAAALSNGLQWCMGHSRWLMSARDCGDAGPRFRWDEERRFLLRAELDAALFHLYGLNKHRKINIEACLLLCVPLRGLSLFGWQFLSSHDEEAPKVAKSRAAWRGKNIPHTAIIAAEWGMSFIGT